VWLDPGTSSREPVSARMERIALEAVAERVAAILSQSSTVVSVQGIWELPGGASSLTYRMRLQNSLHNDVVVKVAPPGLPPVRNRDVLRQARLLQILHGRPGVSVPTVIATDVGDPPSVPPL